MAEHQFETRTRQAGRLVSLFLPSAGRLGVVLLLLFLLTPVNLAMPWFFKLLVDDVIQDRKFTLLALILPGVALAFVARNVLFYYSRMISVAIGEDLCFDLRKRLFEHLQALGLPFHRSSQPGKLGSRVLDDTVKIQQFIQDKLPTLVVNLLMCIVLIGVLYSVHPGLAVASTIILPLQVWTYRYFKQPIKRSYSEAQERLSGAYGHLIEKLLGMEIVKGFTAEKRETDVFREAIHASRLNQIRTQKFEFTQKVAADLLVGAGTIVLFSYGAWLAIEQYIRPGVFVMFYGYVVMLYPAVIEVMTGTGHLSKATASFERVFTVLDEPASDARVATLAEGEFKEPSVWAGWVQFEHVSFRCGDEPGSREILTDLSFSIRPGQHVALVGHSGSGKSTLLSLLPRFIEPTQGRIQIDGYNLKEIPSETLRRGMGVAFQEVFFFNASILDNLLYARPDATLAEVEESCQITGADEFIRRMPEGYQTQVGAEGVQLSRGEKQRLALARCLLKNPSMLVLDEATSSLDVVSAVRIVREMLRRMKGRTVLLVTHKAELIPLCDRVIRLADGRIDLDVTSREYLRHVREEARDRDLEVKHATATLPLFDDSESASPEIEVLVSSAGDHEPAGNDDTAPLARVSEGAIVEERDLTTPPQDPAPEPKTLKIKPAAAGVILLAISLVSQFGCVSESRSSSQIALEQPKASAGYLTEDATDDGFAQLARSLAEREQSAAIAAAAAALGSLPESTDLPESPQSAADVAADATTSGLDPGQFPASAGVILNLPKLSKPEIEEIVTGVALRLQTELSYAAVSDSQWAQRLPAPPTGVTLRETIQRTVPEGQSVLRLGYVRYLSQTPQLWAYGVTFPGDGAAPVPNPDLASLQASLDSTTAGMAAMRTGLLPGELSREIIELSYVDTATAVAALKALGVNALADATQVPPTLEFNQLPLVAAMPGPKPEQTGLVGGSDNVRDQTGLAMLPAVGPLQPDVIGSPTSELLIVFHPAHVDQYARVRELLTEVIDKPARQILVEGLVIEISEQGLKDLGVEWQFQDGTVSFVLGKLNADALGDTLTGDYDDSDNLSAGWTGKIRALIRDGKAQVLSRPSVLTLNNRQASIRVGQDIPIATSTEGTAANSNRVAFAFRYIPTGIILNVRPRISENGNDVTMLIDTTVSATVPGQDLEIRSSDDEILASAPTISTRRVQTYGRIQNNTPFIIGGLVSRDQTVTKEKVPLLGDLPIVGPAFRAEKTETHKQEVIIVLTPYVLPDEGRATRLLPKDTEARFDSADNELFHDSYRLTSADVFDLAFLFRDPRLVEARRKAEAAIADDYRLAFQRPWRAYADNRTPGEAILVQRMMYEVIKRLNLEEKIDPSRLILLMAHQTAGYEVEFLEDLMKKQGGGATYADFFARNPGKALAITFSRSGRGDTATPLPLGQEPIPQVRVLECADRSQWSKLLWDLNQPSADGLQQSTVILQNESDMVRLRRAAFLKRLLTLNGGESEARVRNFNVGKQLLIPELAPGQTLVVDGDVATLFFRTEMYYPAALQEIEQSIDAINAADAQRNGK